MKIIHLLALVSILCLTFTGCGDNNQLSPEPGNQGRLEMAATCTDGMAADKYKCKNVDLVARLSPDTLMGNTLNDIWGWTDPETGKEYALVGLTDGVSFVDISEPDKPKVIGKLVETKGSASAKSTGENSPGFELQHEEKSLWRDFKVYQNYLFVVSDNQEDNGINHGMQAFDLTRLRDMTAPAEEYTADVVYDEFYDAHNIAINEESGFAYIVGSMSHGPGLHMVNIQNPLQPKFAGYYADTTAGGYVAPGYIHDAQCVMYQGPDEDYQGREVCFNSSEKKFLLVDVTDKTEAYTISEKSYQGNAYAHQGWLTEDHQYFLLDDELDEMHDHSNTRTYIWDVRDLDNPEMIGVYESTQSTIDHNQYVKGNYTYQANYTSGLRILDLSEIASGTLEEVAYFDTYAQDDHVGFDGAWSNYPFFESGIVIVSDMSGGLFILKPNL